MRIHHVLCLSILLAPASCKKSGDQPLRLNGAGATFPYPLYSKWVAEFQRIDPRITVNYQSIGSGGGIRQLLEKTVDFGASDAPMTDEQLAKSPAPILHIPTTLGAVAVAYNLGSPAPPEPLRLTGKLVAAVFLGAIKKWNDPAIASLNPALALPDKDITVVHRSDGSGTTAVFTDYLSKVSPEWKQRAGTGTSVSWPAGQGAKGNEGVTGQLKTSPYSLGYVELAYAKQSQLATAALENQHGAFVQPTMEGVTLAAKAFAATMPDDLRQSIVDAPAEGAYPLASFSYVLTYRSMTDPARAAGLAKFLWWAIHDGQRLAPALDYAPLPENLVPKIEAKLRTIEAGGKPTLGPSGG